jgi:hypothetical protein
MPDDLLKRLESLAKPHFTSDEHRWHLRLALVSARRSSRAGYLLVALPCLFLLGVLLKYWLGLNLGLFDWLENTLAQLDQHPVLKWVAPLVLLAGPLVGLALNLLAILHVTYDRREAELLIRVKLRWANLLVAGLCLLVALVFLGYLLAENYAQVQSLFFRFRTV